MGNKFVELLKFGAMWNRINVRVWVYAFSVERSADRVESAPEDCKRNAKKLALSPVVPKGPRTGLCTYMIREHEGHSSPPTDIPERVV